MKFTYSALAALICIAGSSVAFAQKGGGAGLSANSMKSSLDSVSYAIGMQLGQNMKQDALPLNTDRIRAGINDVWQGKPTWFTEEAGQMVMLECQQKIQSKTVGDLPIDSMSYAIGMNIGKSMKEDSVALNGDLIGAGMNDVWQGKPTKFSAEVSQGVMAAFQQRMMALQQQKVAAKGPENQKKGDAFLSTNKTKPGVKTTASGLQYMILNEGSGDSPDANDVVSVNYRGALIDGTEFDKSQPGKPAQFPVNGVIKGWTEALQLMKPGAKWRLFIPASLAYGATGAGGVIGPNETLVFDVELLSITKQ